VHSPWYKEVRSPPEALSHLYVKGSDKIAFFSIFGNLSKLLWCVLLRLGTLYPCSRAVNLGVQHGHHFRHTCSRVHGRQYPSTVADTACVLSTHVNETWWQKAFHGSALCQHGPWTRVLGTHYPCSQPVDTACEHLFPSLTRPLMQLGGLGECCKVAQ